MASQCFRKKLSCPSPNLGFFYTEKGSGRGNQWLSGTTNGSSLSCSLVGWGPMQCQPMAEQGWLGCACPAPIIEQHPESTVRHSFTRTMKICINVNFLWSGEMPSEWKMFFLWPSDFLGPFIFVTLLLVASPPLPPTFLLLVAKWMSLEGKKTI